MSFLESVESSEDDEANSLDHRMTNEAIVASSAGGLSKSVMGRAAALGMDVGSIEANNQFNIENRRGNGRFHPPRILKKKMTSMMKKAKEVKELWSSKHLVGPHGPARRSHESSPSDELQFNASELSDRHPQGYDLFSVDALASQRSSVISLVNKLGMAPEVSPDLKHHSANLSQCSLDWKNDHSQQF